MNGDEKHDPNLDDQNNSFFPDTLLSIFLLLDLALFNDELFTIRHMLFEIFSNIRSHQIAKF